MLLVSLGHVFLFRLCSPSRRAKKLASELMRSLYGNFPFLFFSFWIEESKSKSNPAITICCSVDQEILESHDCILYGQGGESWRLRRLMDCFTITRDRVQYLTYISFIGYISFALSNQYMYCPFVIVYPGGVCRWDDLMPWCLGALALLNEELPPTNNACCTS